jgi:hypothetical protein
MNGTLSSKGLRVPLIKPVMPHISSYHKQTAREEYEGTVTRTQDTEPQESRSTVH